MSSTETNLAHQPSQPNDSAACCDCDGFGAIFRSELLQDAAHVHLHGALRKCTGVPRYRGFGFPSQRRTRTSISRAVRLSSPTCSASGAATSGGTRFLPACTSRIARSNSLGACSLNRYPRAPGFERSPHFHVAFQTRKHDDTGRWKFGSDRSQCVDSSQIGQPNIHDGYVGPMLPVLANSLLDLPRLERPAPCPADG